MKLLPGVSLCVFALSFVPSFASGDETPLAERARLRVETGLVKPLAEQRVARFSRTLPPPTERRVRVPQTEAMNDKSGNSFLPFAIDIRFGSGAWRSDDIVGCVYVRTGELFVKRGDSYRPAAFLLGKSADPVPGVCEAVPAPKRT